MIPYTLFAGALLLLIGCGVKRRQLEHRIRELESELLFDTLTKLYTRRFMENRLMAMESEAERNAYTDVFVLFIDIDHFGMVNNTHGHGKGDQVLKTVAGAIMSQVRTNDIAARWGGEEVLVIGRGNGQILAERIRRAVEVCVTENIHVTVSIGATNFSPETETIAQAIERADKALYEAKRDGRNRVVAIQKP